MDGTDIRGSGLVLILALIFKITGILNSSCYVLMLM
jgi:hypothetical protein